MCSHLNIDVLSSVPLCGATWLKSLLCFVFFLCPLLCARGGGWLRWPVCPSAAAAKAGAQCLQGSQPGYTTLKPTVPHKLPRIHSLVLTVPSEVLPHTHPGHATLPTVKPQEPNSALSKKPPRIQDTGNTLGLLFSPKIHHSALQTTKDTPLGIFTGKYMYVYPITLYQHSNCAWMDWHWHNFDRHCFVFLVDVYQVMVGHL